MPKRYRHLYPQLTDWDNLLLAWRKARKGKRGHAPAATFEMNATENLLGLQHCGLHLRCQDMGLSYKATSMSFLRRQESIQGQAWIPAYAGMTIELSATYAVNSA